MKKTKVHASKSNRNKSLLFSIFHFSLAPITKRSNPHIGTPSKVVGYPIMDQKGCLNLVKKDQLCAIALMNRYCILKFFTRLK